MHKVERECKKCGAIKSIEDFYKHPYGHRYECKKCISIRAHKRNQITKEERAIVNRKYNQSHPEVGRRGQRNYRYRKYGLSSAAEFDQLILDQDGKCKICLVILKIGQGKNAAHMDHDHNTGTRRDVLCSRCNNVIGMVEEDLNLLNSIIQYIKRWSYVQS